MAKLDELSAKIAPVADKVKSESLPAWHALRYCLVWLAWVATLPVALLGEYLGAFSKSIKPELPPKA